MAMDPGRAQIGVARDWALRRAGTHGFGPKRIEQELGSKGIDRASIHAALREAFAEVDQFLDTPVKHYSSGMYVRLAFSVAAHLEPEILLVDEVLAVGDIAFQRKCLGKMDDVAQQGSRKLVVHGGLLPYSAAARPAATSAGRVDETAA